MSQAQNILVIFLFMWVVSNAINVDWMLYHPIHSYLHQGSYCKVSKINRQKRLQIT